MRPICLPILFLFAVLAGCHYQKAELTPEIQVAIDSFNGSSKQPMQNFFREAQYSHLQISPDGRFIAALFPRNGINSLAILSSDLKQVVYTWQFDDKHNIFQYEWVNNTRLVLWAGLKFGYLDGRRSGVQTYFVDYDGKNLQNFFSKTWADYDLIRILPDEPDSVIMAKYYWRERGRPIAVKVNVNNGVERVLTSPPIGSGHLLADAQGEVNVAVETSNDSYDKSQIHYRLGRGTSWTQLQYPAKGKGHLEPIFLDRKAKALYLSSDKETGRSGIYRLDLVSGESKAISTDPKVDIDEIIMDDDQLVGVIYDPDYPEIDVIDAHSIHMQIYRDLLLAFKGQRVRGLSLTRDRSAGVFMVSSDLNAGEYYKIDTKSRHVTRLGSSRSWLVTDQLAAMKPIAFKARDGREINGYLTLPPQGTQKNLPAVLLVHGGPHGVRDVWGFDSEAQFLASRGFAVLQVNYRGSAGYGREFLESGYRQWGLSMQDDLTDATHWLVNEGYADARRLAIYGASYGGYAALMGAVREPDLYRCAATYVGVSDLTIQKRSSDTATSSAGEEYLDKALGTDTADLKKRSALYNIDRIKVPIFIAAGKDDQRVPYSNSSRLRDALEAAHKPYEWMSKDSEGHGFQQEANRLEFYMRLATFLEKNTAL